MPVNMQSKEVIKDQEVDLSLEKDGDNTRTWANALKEAASFVGKQAFTFGGKLMTLPHKRFEFEIGADHTLSTIYAQESKAYTAVSDEIEKSKSEITTLEQTIKGLTEALGAARSDTDAQVADKKSLSDANADLKKAKSSLNKSNMSLWFAAFTNTIAKTPKYLYNLGNNSLNVFLRALGVVINACAFALYAVSYLLLQLRILVASVMKSNTEDMSSVWDTANEQTSYTAVVYTYLTSRALNLSNVNPGEKLHSSSLEGGLEGSTTPKKSGSENTPNADLTRQGEGHSNTPGY